MRSYWVRVGPVLSNWCSYKKAIRRQRPIVGNKTETEIRVMCLQAEELQGLLSTTGSEQRGMEQIFPKSLQK